MNTVHRKKWRLARVASLAFVAMVATPLAAHALGLGKLRVHSALNQPLNAEIEFTSLTEAEVKGLKAGLAGRADFSAAGIERATILSQLVFALDRRSDGRYVLRLSTATPFDEPFLHTLIQIDWTGGRLVREYTALIDPPYQIAAKAPRVEPPRAVPPPPVQPDTVVVAPTPVTPPVEHARIEGPATVALGPSGALDVAMSPDGWPTEEGQSPAVKPAASVPKSAVKGRIGPTPSWATSASHTIRRGDTLWSIAKNVRSDSNISVAQAAVAIYQANPGAFYDNNLNNIRTGRILRMPEREAVESLSREKAHSVFQAQFDDWQQYKQKLAGARRTSSADEPQEPDAKDDESKRAKTSEGAATSKKSDASSAKGRRSDDMLKIVRSNLHSEKGSDAARKGSEPAKGAEHEQARLADRAATLEESLVSKQIEQKELGAKIDQVRTLLKRQARLIEIESKALAPAPEKADKPAEPAKSEPVKPEVVKPEPPKSETPKTETPKAEAPKPAPKAEAPAPAAKAKRPPPPPPPPAQKGFVDSLLGDLLLPILLGVVGLASVVIGFIYMRRRRQAKTEFEESILASQLVPTENLDEAHTSAEGGATAAESSILSDISQANLANVHTDEVDPIAEAEVYLAYGRDETAEEILKDAVKKHPQRQELKMKLLEIYSARKDVKSFETLAEEVFAAVGGQGGKHWDKIEEMGHKLNPSNPMFRGPTTRAAANVAPGKSAETPASAVSAKATAVEPAPTAPPAATPAASLDFDLGSSEEAVTADITAGSAKEPAFDLDFDLSDLKTETAKVEPTPTPAAAVPATKSDGGLDLSLDALDLGSPTTTGTTKATSFDLDFDLGQPEAPSQPPAPTPSTAQTGDDFVLDLDLVPASTNTDEPAAAEAKPMPSAGQQQQWDEAATKLDLARAYIDMGDAEGARSILEEVTTEGNPEQKKQAQDLISQIR